MKFLQCSLGIVPRFVTACGSTFVLMLAMAGSPAPCIASFHFMQVEKVVAGVNGDTSAQAVQLRMRVAAQDQVNRAKLLAYDAAGQNPVVLVDFSVPVANNAAGSTILIASTQLQAYTEPPVSPDFTLEQLIPQSYLAAGSLVFENDEETLLVWRFSWGGAAYTGDTTGAMTNDDDREFGPPFADPLPSDGLQALEFKGGFDAKSTSNEADYEVSAEAATLTNNAGASFTLVGSDCTNPDAPGPDTDGDGVRDACDSCPNDPGKSEPGECGCGVSDADSDGDGTPNCMDTGSGGGNDNGNDNGSNDNTTGNGNENGNANGNDNANANDNGGADNGNNNDTDNNNDSNGNGNQSGGGPGPRGCAPGSIALFALTLALNGLRFLSGATRRGRHAQYQPGRLT